VCLHDEDDDDDGDGGMVLLKSLLLGNSELTASQVLMIYQVLPMLCMYKKNVCV